MQHFNDMFGTNRQNIPSFCVIKDTAIAVRNIKTAQNSLVSQLVPLNPAKQVQLYEFTLSVQTPPFRHGFGAQSSISEIED